MKPYFSAGWAALRAVNRTAGFLLRRLEQATGVSALAEISDFFTSMSGLFEDFHARVERAYEVLRGAETAFVLVASPEEQVLGDAEYFCAQDGRAGMPLKGVVFNRVHREYRSRAAASAAAASTRTTSRSRAASSGRLVGDADARRALVENFLDYQALARGEQLRMEQFAAGLPKRRAAGRACPNFPRDVHDLAGAGGDAPAPVRRRPRAALTHPAGPPARMAGTMATIDDVLTFWFGPAPAADAAGFGARMQRWYLGGPAEDVAIRERFADTIERAGRRARRLGGDAAGRRRPASSGSTR